MIDTSESQYTHKGLPVLQFPERVDIGVTTHLSVSAHRQELSPKQTALMPRPSPSQTSVVLPEEMCTPLGSIGIFQY